MHKGCYTPHSQAHKHANLSVLSRCEQCMQNICLGIPLALPLEAGVDAVAMAHADGHVWVGLLGPVSPALEGGTMGRLGHMIQQPCCLHPGSSNRIPPGVVSCHIFSACDVPALAVKQADRSALKLAGMSWLLCRT